MSCDKARLVNLIREAEDAAREVRHRMKHRTTAVLPHDIIDLSSALVRGLQAVAEALDAITTSEFRR